MYDVVRMTHLEKHTCDMHMNRTNSNEHFPHNWLLS